MILVLLAAAPRHAHAERDPFVEAVAAVAAAFSVHHEPVSTPDVIVGGWVDDRFSVSAGWVWGDKETGFLAASSYQRVLVESHFEAHDSIAATYGVLGDFAAFDAGVDAGVEADARGAGPAGRLQLGVGGFSLRVGGAYLFGREPRFDTRTEVVFDVASLIGKL